MGTVRGLATQPSGVRLADAVAAFLATVAVPNTRRGYAAACNQMVSEFGAGSAVGDLDPDQLAAWFTSVWGNRAAKTFNTRLTALGSACSYWRDQGWLTGDPLVRLRTRPTSTDRARALTTPQVELILAPPAPLRDRVLWTLLYESAARTEEALTLNVTDLDTANRCAVVTRKGGARDVIVWQTGTARLLPRLLAGRRRGPVFCTDRAARPSVALVDVDPATGKARLSYRRAAELFEAHTAGMPGGPFTLHQLRHSALTHAAEAGASTPMLMALSGHTSVRSLAIYARVSAEALGKWQAERDPAARRNGPHAPRRSR
ncbi:MAG: tyrosine-type recombinase/integrase [Pseudonocardiaceae bacterium]